MHDLHASAQERGGKRLSDGEGFKELACDGRTSDQEEFEENPEGFIAGNAFVTITFSGRKGLLGTSSIVLLTKLCAHYALQRRRVGNR
jgi:hypothetical protein